MKVHCTLGFGVAALLLVSGCAHTRRINSAAITESGTHVVSTEGALTIARQSANASHVCTLRTAGHKRGKRGGGAAPPDGGPAQILDVLLFRLCEARANNDISAEQYAASVQAVLKTISAMAERRPPPGPGMRRPQDGAGRRGRGMTGPGWRRPGMGGPGMGGPGWQRRGGPDGADEPRGRRRGPEGPPRKDDAKPKKK